MMYRHFDCFTLPVIAHRVMTGFFYPATCRSLPLVLVLVLDLVLDRLE